MESEDPPTPRMYKAIIPTGGPGQMQSNISAPHSPKMALEAAQVVLHQGHFAHGRQHASLQRHAQHAGQEQAMEDLKHTVRHALTGSMSCGNSLQQQQALSCLHGLEHCNIRSHLQMDLLLIYDCPVKYFLLQQLADNCVIHFLLCKHLCTCLHQQRCAVGRRTKIECMHHTVVLQGEGQADRLAPV